MISVDDVSSVKDLKSQSGRRILQLIYSIINV